MPRRSGLRALATALTLAAIVPARANDSDDLSKKLQNPFSDLVSVPIQGNFDWRGGSNDRGFASTTNIQPVVPVSLDQDWNVIIRTILPFSYRTN